MNENLVRVWFWSRAYNPKKKFRSNMEIYKPVVTDGLLKRLKPFRFKLFGYTFGITELVKWEYDLLK